MARKPTDIVQLKLRLPEHLRARIERLAHKNDRSLNSEMVAMLEAHFSREETMTMIKSIAVSSATSAVDAAFERLNLPNRQLPGITKPSEGKT